MVLVAPEQSVAPEELRLIWEALVAAVAAEAAVVVSPEVLAEGRLAETQGSVARL